MEHDGNQPYLWPDEMRDYSAPPRPKAFDFQVVTASILGALLVAFITGGLVMWRDSAALEANLANLTVAVDELKVEVVKARGSSHTHIPGQPGFYAPGAVEPED